MTQLERRSTTGSFQVPADIDRVFPMFDPREEARWAPGWAIQALYPQPFTVERNAVFTTESGDKTALWTVLQFDPERHRAEYLVVVPEFQQRWITVTCDPVDAGTKVTVTYEVSALSAEGTAALDRYGETFILGWQAPVTAAVLGGDAHAPA